MSNLFKMKGEDKKNKNRFDFIGIWRNVTFIVAIFGLILLIISKCS